MNRRALSLCLLVVSVCEGYCQDIQKYEYWTDDDYKCRTVVESSETDILLSVELKDLQAGIHFLNFRAYRQDGVWGNVYRYIYYIPTLNNPADGEMQMEYWLDDNLQNLKRAKVTDNELSLAIDISTINAGVHFFNCTPIDSEGSRGNSERYVFYVPRTLDLESSSPIVGYEYWLDDAYKSRVEKNSDEGECAFAIDISQLGSGVHYFNCRAKNERGAFGNLVRQMFYIPDVQFNQQVKLGAYEYWLDDDYAARVYKKSGRSYHTFRIDIDYLTAGIHFFNYRSFNKEGKAGSPLREVLYIAHDPNNASCEPIEYEYWIDDDEENKVSGEGTAPLYVFSIDVANLELGWHTFNFRARNLLEEWGETFTQKFRLSDLPTTIEKIAEEKDVFDVYSLYGKKVLNNAKADDLYKLVRGIYVIDDKKVIIP